VMGAFTLAYAVFEIPSGALGDRIGPRKVLTRIVLWWSVFTSLTGVVTGYVPLLAVRFLFGAGEAGAFPNCAATISRWVPASERGRASSLVWIATAVGGAITPLLVIPLQQAYGWRVSFYLFGGIGVIWAAIWYGWFRDTPVEKRGVSATEIDLIGQPLRARREGVPWSSLLRDRNFRCILFMYHTYCWGAYFFLSWLPTYLQVGRGLSEDQMRIASSLPSWAGGLGILAGGFLSDRLARTHSLRVARSAIGAAGLIAAGVLLIAATLIRNNTIAIVLITLGLGAMDLMLPVAWAVCLDIGRENAGAISGAMNMSGQVGSFLSSVAFGYLVGWLGTYDKALMPLAAMLLVSGVAFAAIDPAHRITAPALPSPAGIPNEV
jgi:MFS transporter, ACS family, glucarate transporter